MRANRSSVIFPAALSFLHRLALRLRVLPGASHDSLGKLRFILAGKLRQPLDFAKHHLFQKIDPDVMRRRASTTISFVVGASVKLDVVILLVEVVVQIVTAIGTDQQTREHTRRSVLFLALADLSPLLLDLLPNRTLHDGRMYVLENRPILRVVINALFQLVGLGIGLEVHNIAAVFLKG